MNIKVKTTFVKKKKIPNSIIVGGHEYGKCTYVPEPIRYSKSLLSEVRGSSS